MLLVYNCLYVQALEVLFLRRYVEKLDHLTIVIIWIINSSYII